MKWAKTQAYIDSNPIEDMEVPAAEAKEVYISPEEFAVFRTFVRNGSLGDLMDLTYDCGCRPQESLRVTAKEVVDLARSVAEASGLPALLSGGVHALADLEAAARVPEIAGAIVGKALYDGLFTLEDALIACRVEILP